jgi:large subunit ribosomal protein L3
MLKSNYRGFIVLRSGLLAKKIGMSRIFKDGKHHAITLLDMSGCRVTAHKTTECDGYNALQVGLGDIKEKNVSKPLKGHFAKNGVEAAKTLKEFRVDEKNLVPVGSQFLASHFVVGQKVDLAGKTIGKGFAGVMKRHNFAGLRASHGVSISHRSHGSTGQCQDPGRVFKGKKMAGHMGDTNVTVQNIEVMWVSDEDGLVAVKGAIPGSKNSILSIADAVKVPNQDVPTPASLKASGGEE